MPAFSGRCTGEFLVLRPTSLNRSYLFRYLTTPEFIARVDGSTYGAKMPRADWRFIGHMPVPRPPLPEQRRIADFLDRETDKIDRLIAEKEKLIGLLEEKRKAVTSHAVTKGLNPDVKMRDSRVPWLGRIPEHWKIMRLKSLTRQDGTGIQIGPFGGMLKSIVREQTPFKLYGQENIIASNFTKGSRWLVSQDYHQLKHNYELLPGDLVVTRKGSLGAAQIVPTEIQPGIIDSDTIRLRFNVRKMLFSYAAICLREALYVAVQIERMQRGAILAGLNSTVLGNLIVLTPPTHEQQSICNVIDAFNMQTLSLLNEAQTASHLLRERRAALISAAVTGRLDVREAAE